MSKQKKQNKNSGFTLLELSLVLVIIAFITGGIFAGRELIKASEINSVIAQFKEYETAYKNFEVRYNALPGDFSGATDYWPTSANGNGNREILWSSGESLRAWQHLALSGIMSGNYAGTGATVIANTNAPASKLARGAFAFYYANPSSLIGFNGSNAVIGNYLEIVLSGTALTSSSRGLLRPVDAAAIDSKIDDGVFSTGRILGGIGSTVSTNSVAMAGCMLRTSGYEYFLGYSQQDAAGAACTLSYIMQ